MEIGHLEISHLEISHWEISHWELESFLFCGPTGCNSLAQPNGLGIRANKSGDLKGRDSRVCS